MSLTVPLAKPFFRRTNPGLDSLWKSYEDLVATSLRISPKFTEKPSGSGVTMVVSTLDQYGSPLSVQGISVTFGSSGVAGSFLGPNPNDTAAGGRTGNIFLPSATGTLTLSVSASGLTGDSYELTITGEAAADSITLTPAGTSTVEKDSPILYTATIYDQYGDRDTSYTENVVFSSTGVAGSWSPSDTVAAVGGVATATFTPSATGISTIKADEASVTADTATLWSIEIVSPTQAGDNFDILLSTDAQSFFDAWTDSPTATTQAKINARWKRLQCYSPNDDAIIAWFPYCWDYSSCYSSYNEDTEFDSGANLQQYVLKDPDNKVLYVNFQCNTTGPAHPEDQNYTPLVPYDVGDSATIDMDAGGIPTVGCARFAMDITDAGWRTHYINEAVNEIISAGYLGGWIDNVNLVRLNGNIPVSDGIGNWTRPIDPSTGSLMDDSAWNAAMIQMMTELRAALPASKELVFNIYWGVPKDQDLTDLAAIADYVNLERIFLDPNINNGTGNFSFAALLSYCDQIHGAGTKLLIDTKKGGVSDNLSSSEFEYVRACYFLVKEDGDILGVDDTDFISPDVTVGGSFDSRLDIDLGAVLGPRQKNGNVYTREYENGTVTVDISAAGGPPNWTGSIGSVVTPPLTLVGAALPDGKVNAIYSGAILTSTGGTPPYSYAVTAGSLPPGLSLSSGGVISGTPTTDVGSPFIFTVTVTDDDTSTDTEQYQISVDVLPDKILRFTGSTDEGTVGGTIAYRLRWVPDSGDKVWTTADLALPYIQISAVGTPSNAYTIDISSYSELSGLVGVYDVGLTAVDAAGNESSFIEVEDAKFDF